MKFTLLNGKIEKESKIILDNFKNKCDMIYLLNSKSSKLHAYITALNNALDDEIRDSIMFSLKICYEKSGLHISYLVDGSDADEKISSMSTLIDRLDNKPCRIIVNSNDRKELADISQQLIFIGYPLTSVDIMLRKEKKDSEKTKHFMARINTISASMSNLIDQIDDIYTKWQTFDISANEKENLLGIISEAKDRCSVINDLIETAKSVELKVAVAASKKTGKSVIVNSMIGMEIAPTSLSLATPNNCIYRKSADRLFHLKYERINNGKPVNYVYRKEIHNVIDNEFRRAEQDALNGYTLPNMEIEYVTEGSNFDNFTVYDTPGPDLAGSRHRELALDAMRECDVAIFAIDYSKFLTNDEENFLQWVKTEFNDKQKYASLIFTINKLDLRYSDSSSVKSSVHAIDLIRSKLIDIDKEMYGDCIIFATSALQYYNTILCSEVLGKQFSEAEDLNRMRVMARENIEVRNELLYLNSLADHYYIGHGLDKLTAVDLKKYSGMPDLLNYVAYICKSKARDEIVNNITANIDAHSKALKAINDRIENIDKLIKSDEAQILRIREIIDEYNVSMKDLLSDNIFRRELENNAEEENTVANEKTRFDHLTKIIDKAKANSISFNDVKTDISNLITSECPKECKAYDEIFNHMEDESHTNLIKELDEFQKKFHDQNDKLLNDKLLLEAKVGVTDNDIDTILGKVFSSDRLSKFSKEYIGNKIDDMAENATKNGIKPISSELTALVNNRIKCIRLASNICKEKLEKLDVSLRLPEVPDFSFAIPEYYCTPDVEGIDLYLDLKDLANLFKGNKFNFIKKFIYNITTKFEHKGQDTFDIKRFTYEDFESAFKKSHFDVIEALRNAKVYEILNGEKDKLVQQFEKDVVNKIYIDFSNILSTLKSTIEKFTGLIDDTSFHRDNIEAHEREKALIREIDENSADFNGIWNEVIKSIKFKEEVTQ